MKTLLTIIISLGLIVSGASIKTNTEKVNVTIKVEGLRSAKGSVGISLYNEKGEFPGEGAIQTKVVKLESTKHFEVVFEGLEAGEYAVALMHDENGNGDLDFNEYGMPLEGFGFSNNVDVSMGPATFQQAAFKVNESVNQSISLLYLGGY